jgi:hypothetical protein
MLPVATPLLNDSKVRPTYVRRKVFSLVLFHAPCHAVAIEPGVKDN